MALMEYRVDDLDGSEGAETLVFSMDGVEYEIDLASKNRAKFEKAMETWVSHARALHKPRASRTSANGTRKRIPANLPGKADQMNAMREWARANGMKVSDRGRVPRAVEEAYAEAHAPKKTPALTK